MFYFLSISIISPAASSRIHPASHSSRDENISLRHGTKRTVVPSRNNEIPVASRPRASDPQQVPHYCG